MVSLPGARPGARPARRQLTGASWMWAPAAPARPSLRSPAWTRAQLTASVCLHCAFVCVSMLQGCNPRYFSRVFLALLIGFNLSLHAHASKSLHGSARMLLSRWPSLRTWMRASRSGACRIFVVKPGPRQGAEHICCTPTPARFLQHGQGQHWAKVGGFRRYAQA